MKGFVNCGAEKVFALDKSKSLLDKLLKQCLNGHVAVVVPVVIDLSDWNATKEAFEEIGPIDILVNNAAVYIPELFLDAKPENFDMCVYLHTTRSLLAYI